MSKRLFLFLCIVSICVFVHAQSFSTPKHELRAVWLTTIGGLDWPHQYARTPEKIQRQQHELTTLLDQYLHAGINTVLLQTRVRGTVIYPSDIEPWDGCLSGTPGVSPGYDPLRFAINECHKRGMEIHAWVVTMPVGKWNKTGCVNLRKKYPGLIKKIGDEGYMNPENPMTGRYLAKICGELTRRYDIDGIHLDYIRYPEMWKIIIPRTQARQMITNIVKDIHDSVKSIKPWVKMSCSPIGKYDDLARYWSHGWNAYTKVCQDAQGWLSHGLMDQLYPMMYFRDNQFFPFAIDWAENLHGRSIAPGLGIYFLNPKEGTWKLSDVTREMYVLRDLGLGHTFFRGKFLTDNNQGIYDFVCQFNNHPALVPAMSWVKNIPTPTSPTHINLSDNELTWSGNTPYYNVYASRTYPVDTKNAEHLIAIRRPDMQLVIPTKGWYFAVTGMDRYGNESAPLQSHTQPPSGRSQLPLLTCDGQHLQVPAKAESSDAEMLVIETMQGQIIDTQRYHGNQLDIKKIPNGFYVLKSLGNNGIAHRLGYFMIKRDIPSYLLPQN